MRGNSYKGQTPVLTAELQQLRTALDLFRNSRATLETEALRASRHYPRSSKRDNREIEELRALVAALPESGHRRRLLNMPNLASLLGHAGLIAFVLLCASHQVSRSGLIPVSIESLAKDSHQSKPLEKPAEPKERSRLEVSQANPELTPTAPLPNDSGSADQAKNFGSADQTERALPDSFSASARPQEAAERYLWNANSTSVQVSESLIDFSEQGSQGSPGLRIVRKTDWQDNPVEDQTLTYSTQGNAVRLTTREVSSAGFAGTNFVRDLSLNDEATSQPFGLTATELGDNAIAKSQRVDWRLVDLKDFGVTVFGYQNEVGADFKPFGQAENEFETPGTTTLKAGSQLRVGAFGFGFSQSNVTSSADAVPGFSESRQESLATKQEASVTLDLSHLLPGTEAPSGLTSNLLPTLWVSASDKTSPSSGPGAVATDTIATSIGGSWKWKDAYATLGYWDYSSNNGGGVNSSWNGQGFDAAFGAYHSSFGLNLAMSYGRSDDAAGSWQSAGALYNGTVSVSYAPSKLPGVWVSASTGNYDYNGALSDLYAVRTNNEYSSLTAGLDFTNWFWGAESSEYGPSSVKLLYRYSDNVFADSTAGTTKDQDNLVAVMVQRKF
jgi:hypothetical protein